MKDDWLKVCIEKTTTTDSSHKCSFKTSNYLIYSDFYYLFFYFFLPIPAVRAQNACFPGHLSKNIYCITERVTNQVQSLACVACCAFRHARTSHEMAGHDVFPIFSAFPSHECTSSTCWRMFEFCSHETQSPQGPVRTRLQPIKAVTALQASSPMLGDR